MIGSLFGTGIIIGFLIAVPVGPVGVLCAHRTITRGALAGFASGLGAAVADSIFGLIAAFGLSIVSDWITGHKMWVQGVGGIFLLILGVRIILRHEPKAVQQPQPNGKAIGYFASTFALTMTNPITILSFAGIFAAFGVMERVDAAMEAWILVGGVFVGSCLWWLLIGVVALLFRRWISARGLVLVNAISAYFAAAIMIGFSAYALVRVAFPKLSLNLF